MRQVKLLAIVLMLAPVAMGAELIVDRYNGPYYTPEAAYMAANDYDVITIKRGVYPSGDWPAMNSSIGTAGRGTANGVTFRAYHDGSNYHKVVADKLYWYIRYRQNFKFDGLIFVNDTDNANYNFYFRNDGETVDGMEITNCIFYNMDAYGIYCYGANTANQISNTVIDNCTFIGTDIVNPTNHGIRLYRTCFNSTVQDSIFFQLGGYGVYARNPEDRVYVDYSTFWRCNWDDGVAGGFDPVNGPPYDTRYAYVGTGCLVNTTCPNFRSLDPTSNSFGYLDPSCSTAITLGDSEGSYMGARPVPEPATMVLIALGGLLALFRRR
jgi:hypothetical protein